VLFAIIIPLFVDRASAGNVLGPRINSEWTGPSQIHCVEFLQETMQRGLLQGSRIVRRG